MVGIETISPSYQRISFKESFYYCEGQLTRSVVRIHDDFRWLVCRYDRHRGRSLLHIL